MTDLEALTHYLKNVVVNAKQVRACVENHALEKLLVSEIDRLIGFLEGGYNFLVGLLVTFVLYQSR